MEEVIVSKEKGVMTIKFNRPHKLNAFNWNQYEEVMKALNEASTDSTVSVAVLTGSGKFYSSGNDFMSAVIEPKSVKEASAILQRFVETFINFPKILIALLNGPALGIAATTLAFCDLIFASEKAYLETPFTRLGLVPEGCSTYTFPKLFGSIKANEMLLFGYRMTSKEALQHGFVSQLYSSEEKLENIWKKIYEISSFPRNSLIQSKKMIKEHDRDTLLITNSKECSALEEMWQSEEFMNFIQNYFNKKSSKL